MAKYVYLVTSGGVGAWVKGGKFDCLSPKDHPQHYDDTYPSAIKARHALLNKLILQPKIEFITMKFDAKPPYKYHGLVT